MNDIRNLGESSFWAASEGKQVGEDNRAGQKKGRILMQRKEEEKKTCSKLRLDLRKYNDIKLLGPSGEVF